MTSLSKFDEIRRALADALARGVLPKGERLLVAVSGGGDSVALMHAAKTMGPSLGLGEIEAGHVDHGLRPDSADDMAVVRLTADELGVPCNVARVRVDGPGGLQAAAREARYRALEEMRGSLGAARVLTAHTADDQAETVLLRLARGTSVTGLSAIRELDGAVARPLLGVPRRALADYCRKLGLATLNDPANRDERFMRSRARHDILPLMEERLGPGVRDALCRLAATAAEEDGALNRIAAELEGRAGLPEGGVDAAMLAESEAAIARRVLPRRWRAAAGAVVRGAGAQPPVSAAHLDELLRRVRMGGSWRMTLPGGLTATLSCGSLLFHDGCSEMGPLMIPGPGSYELRAARVRLEACLTENREPSGEGFDRVHVPWPPPEPLVVRGWKPGDRLRRGPKVADLMYEARIPRPLRPLTPVVALGDEPIWAVGLASRLDGGEAPWLRIVAAPIQPGKVQSDRKVEPT